MNAGGVSTATCVAVRVDLSRRLSSRSTDAATSVSAQVREPVTPIAAFGIDAGTGRAAPDDARGRRGGRARQRQGDRQGSGSNHGSICETQTPTGRYTRSGPAHAANGYNTHGHHNGGREEHPDKTDGGHSHHVPAPHHPAHTHHSEHAEERHNDEDDCHNRQRPYDGSACRQRPPELTENNATDVPLSITARLL